MKPAVESRSATPARLGGVRAILAACGVLLAGVAGSTAAQSAAAPPKGKIETYYLLVFSDPVEGQETEYNRWYDMRHAPDVVSAPGFVEAQRFMLDETQLPRTKPGLGKYLVIYRIVTDDLAARFADYHRLAPTLQMSPAFGQSEGFTYQALTPVIKGDEVRAERANKHAGR